MSAYSIVDLTTLDIDWFAVDRRGEVAQFASSGTPLLPRVVIENKEINERLGEHLLDKVHRSGRYDVNAGCRKWMNWKNDKERDSCIESFAEFSDLGFYAFCCNYISADERGPYFLVTTPHVPLLIDALPGWAVDLVSSVKFDLLFAETQEISNALILSV